jgi:hypothetical protein
MSNRLTGAAWRAVLAAGVGAAILAASGSAQAAAGNQTCTGGILEVTVTGNLTVPANTLCNVIGTTVNGNVSVGSGAVFVAEFDWFKRNLSTEGANSVFMFLTEVDGNSSFDATSGGISVCGGVSECVIENSNPGVPSANPSGKSKFGNVSITNTYPAGVNFEDNFVAHDLTCYGNAFISNFGVPNTVLGQEFGQCVGL